MEQLAIWTIAIALGMAGAARGALHPLFDTAENPYRHEIDYHAEIRRMGIQPDCDEEKVTFSDLEKIARSPKVKSQQDFLDALNESFPKGMQSFTVVYESQSAQAGGISLEKPGAIRATVDSKVILRYVCDSESDVYDHVELNHFVPETKDAPAHWEFAEFDFTKEPKERIHHNPEACMDCHSAEYDIYRQRPNWEMYPDWVGMYGSHDDIFEFFDKTSPKHAEKIQEGKNYHAFLKKYVSTENPDPCYGALPWPEQLKSAAPDMHEQFQNYPYGIRARSRNYTTRPNLKFTETMSHMLGVKNYSWIQSKLPSDKKETVFLLLALEAAKCDTLAEKPYPKNALDYHLKSLLPKYERPEISSAHIPILRGNPTPQHEPRHPLGMAQALFATSIALGMSPMDWTLNFVEYDRSDYETGGGFGGTGFGQDPFPSSYPDYANYANQYYRRLDSNAEPILADFYERMGRPERVQMFGDAPLTAYVQNEILKRVFSQIPELRRKYWNRKALREMTLDEISNDTQNTDWVFTTTRGEEEWFGASFSCIDDKAGTPAFRSEEDRNAVCTILREKTLALGMTEEKEVPKTRGPIGLKPEQIPPTRLKLFRQYLGKRFKTEREKDAYAYSKAGRAELKSKAFLDFLKKRYKRS